MTGTAIVLLPRQGEQVYKVSSEKVPHMTVLFLGDQSKNPELGDMVSFLEHAASTQNSCGLSVSRRGELGPDKADVLFFDMSYSKDLHNFRSALLKNDSIKKAFDSVPQFPEWTPHLTLGYPESPANDDAVDYPIGWVSFDRVALWTGDSEGPTFPLADRSDWEVSMSDDDPVAAVLAHHGIKGMKWGVRRSAAALSRARAKGPSHEDASRAKATAHQIKKGGTHSVSNRELQDLVTRMNLEQQYGKLKANKPSRFKTGHAHVKTIVSVGKTVNDVASIANGPVGKGLKAAIKAKSK